MYLAERGNDGITFCTVAMRTNLIPSNSLTHAGVMMSTGSKYFLSQTARFNLRWAKQVVQKWHINGKLSETHWVCLTQAGQHNSILDKYFLIALIEQSNTSSLSLSTKTISEETVNSSNLGLSIEGSGS